MLNTSQPQGGQIPNTQIPEALRKFKERDWRWLWAAMINQRFSLPPEATVAPAQRQAYIAGQLQTQQDPGYWIQFFIDQHRNFVINEEAFKWLEKDDDRLLIWMLSRLDKESGNLFGGSLLGTPQASRRDQIILMIDLWNATPEHKLQYLETKKQEWTRIRISESDTRWIDPKNEDQLRWAWDYLLKQFKAIYIPTPVTLAEFHAAVLASLDQLSYEHQAEKRVFLDKMKKTWSQKKYRDSDHARKQFYLPLNKQAIKDLEWLAENSQKKPSEIVEELLAKGVAAIRGL
jgi:hypothetical protein